MYFSFISDIFIFLFLVDLDVDFKGLHDMLELARKKAIFHSCMHELPIVSFHHGLKWLTEP